MALLSTAWSNIQIAAARDDSREQVEILESIFENLNYNLDGDVISETHKQLQALRENSKDDE